MTLQEVARRARVSTATVSRVLNNGASVKSSTRTRVLKVIQELKYSPNVHAQSLAGGRSRSIGVIVSNIENPFFLDVYKTVEAGAHAAGYEVIMANTDYSSERLVTSIRLMLGRRLAGVAAIVSEMDAALIQELSSQRIPVVFYDVGTPRRNITNIRVDYRGGMAKLTSYLYSLGHRRVGYIGHHATLGPIHERVQSLRDATGKYPGLEVDMATDADTLEGGRQAARVLLARSPRPTALGLRQRRHGRRRIARGSHPRAARPRGPVGHRIRQRDAGAIRRARPDHRAHPPRADRPHHLRLPDAGRRPARAGIRGRARARRSGFHRPGAPLTALDFISALIARRRGEE